MASIAASSGEDCQDTITFEEGSDVVGWQPEDRNRSSSSGDSFCSASSLASEEYENYLEYVEASLTSAAEATGLFQNGEPVSMAEAFITAVAGLLKKFGNIGVPLGTVLKVASATLAKEKLMATVASGLRVVADILEDKRLLQGLSSTLQASAATLSNQHVTAVVNGTIEATGTVLESEVVRKQIERVTLFAEQLVSDPAMQEQGKALMKQLEDIANDDDVQAALDSALTLAQGLLENERLRNISSATVSYAGAIVQSRLVQSTSSGVVSMMSSATPAVRKVSSITASTVGRVAGHEQVQSAVRKVSSITASTVSCVAGNERVQNAVGAAIDTTGAVLTSRPVRKATTFGWNTTLSLAGGIARWANDVKKVAFPEKTLQEMEHDLNVLQEDIDAKLIQLQQDQIQLVKDDENARTAARAALARLRENQRTQEELRMQLSRRKRQLLKRKAQEEGVELQGDEF